MDRKGLSRADENRAIRQEATREKLRNLGLLQHVVENSQKLSDLTVPLEPTEVTRLKYACEVHLKLINKYIGDIKAVELTGEDGGPVKLEMAWQGDED